MRKEISRAVYLRSFLCILVVMGHVVGRWKMTDKFFIPVNESQIFPYVSEFINSFHMSLFFALSGFLYCYQVHENKKYDNFFKFGLNKFKRLIVPFLITAALFAPVVLFTTRKTDSLLLVLQNIIVGTQGYHLWYLPALFHVFIFVMIGGRFLTRERTLLNLCVIVISFIISCYYYIIPFHFYIKDAAIYLFFFLAGYYAKLYWDSVKKIFCRHYAWAIVAVILAFAIGNFSTNLILVKRIKACVIDYLLVNVLLSLDFSGGGYKKATVIY